VSWAAVSSPVNGRESDGAHLDSARRDARGYRHHERVTVLDLFLGPLQRAVYALLGGLAVPPLFLLYLLEPAGNVDATRVAHVARRMPAGFFVRGQRGLKP